MPDDKAMTAKELKAAARGMSGLALDTLAQIMGGTGQESAKLAAAREVLDRGHGKPKPLAKPKARVKPTSGGDLTVVIKRFTDAPDPEAGEFEERS
ncbi:hypothetical protein [Phenylobacterium sp.]|uniref:hypothetical protein n=1 Tax=Phenylobacterium sp. TaxID=1871053 RepID=UPI00374D7958